MWHQFEKLRQRYHEFHHAHHQGHHGHPGHHGHHGHRHGHHRHAQAGAEHVYTAAPDAHFMEPHFMDQPSMGQHFMGRHGHRGGRGFGGMGGGFMDDGGPGSLRMGRKLSSSDLQLLVLALLAEKPRHGYEVIKTLEERSNGFYAPSPGMVYPALTYLEEIGHATVELDNARKRYHITAEGQAHLDAHEDLVVAMYEQLEHIGTRMERMRRAFSDEGEGGADDDDGRYGRLRSQEIRRARRALKTALHEVSDSSPAEQKRIADILLRAAEAIRNPGRDDAGN